MATGGWRDRLEGIAGDFLGDAQRMAMWALAGSGPAPYEIAPYRGYGDANRVLVLGRALESKDIAATGEHDDLLINLLNTYKRVRSSPLPGARVRATIGGVERELIADKEGFFREWISLDRPLATDEPWEPVSFRLVGPLRANQPDVRATGQIRIPSSSSTFGVISDLDDTVIQSRVSNFLRAAQTVMLGNARTRLPFAGVAEFYQALERGGDGTRRNPIFYVSSSPWNLYDVIAEFLELQKIPHGPILLRDWDVDLNVFNAARLQQHKEPLIREILDTYPNLSFILIGDTSQHDPEIYRGIVHAYPGRILAVYIRDVTANPERSAAVRALAEEVVAKGSALVLAEDTAAAAAHASEKGWIV